MTVNENPPTISASSSSEPTFIHEIFQGVLTSETRCLNCETISSKDENFFDLQVDVDQNTSITHCLRCFSNTETLCSDNKFKCDNCCSYQEAQKRMRVKKLPMILALQLKRFKYMEQYNRHIKVSHRVVFPLELRLFNTVSFWTVQVVSSAVILLNFYFLTVWWRCQPRSYVRFVCCRDSLWFQHESRSLHQHCEVSWLLAALWRWHGWQNWSEHHRRLLRTNIRHPEVIRNRLSSLLSVSRRREVKEFRFIMDFFLCSYELAV